MGGSSWTDGPLRPAMSCEFYAVEALVANQRGVKKNHVTQGGVDGHAFQDA